MLILTMINHPQPLSVLLWSLKVQGQLGTIFRPQWTFMEPFMCTALAQCTAHQCVHLVTFFNGNSRHTPVCTEFLHSFPFMHSCFTAEPKCMLWSSAEHCNSTLDDSSSLNGGRRGNHAKQTKSQGIIIATFLVLILLIGVFCSCYIMSSSIL